MKVVLEMPFFTFSNADIQFGEKELTWSSYTTKEALPTTQRIERIDKKKFAKAALDKNIKAFMIHVSSLSLRSKISTDPAQKAQIALLITKKVIMPAKY